MKIGWASCYDTILIVNSLLKTKSFDYKASKIKQLPYYLYIIESQMPKSESRENMLTLIIEPIH